MRERPQTKCHYCNRGLTKESRTKDHKIPKSKGGQGKDNYVWSCYSCNNRKADMDYDDFVSRTRPRLLGIKKPDGTFLEPRVNNEAHQAA